jgi:hypothetical protein
VVRLILSEAPSSWRNNFIFLVSLPVAMMAKIVAHRMVMMLLPPLAIWGKTLYM